MIVNEYNIAPHAHLSGADLSGFDLSGADLSHAHLSGTQMLGTDLRSVNLSSANLCGANLRGAKLSGANLHGAQLMWADLRGANLRHAKNFYLLPVQDPRGFSFAHAVNSDTGWLIVAHRRRLTIDAATLHWGTDYDGDREIADMYLAAINWLRKKESI